MLDAICDFLISSLPTKVQIGCAFLFVALIVALLAWAYWPEAW